LNTTILTILTLFAAAAGAAAQPVSVAFDSKDPPFMFQGTDKTPQGLYPKVFAEVFRRMGVAVDLRAEPWKRALSGCDAGDNGVGGIYKTREREAKYDYSAPYYQEHVAVYSLSAAHASFTKLEDLFGKRVAVIRGWSYGAAFDAAAKAGKIKTDESDGDGTSFKKLSLGREDFVIAIVEAGDAEISSQGWDKTMERSATLLTTNDVFLVFNKSKQMKTILAQFDSAVAAMKRDGTFQQIVKQAFSK